MNTHTSSQGYGLPGTVTVVVIGAGHAGLAMSYYLTLHAIDHVVLEKGRVANAWGTNRWDSLRLLTPNWQTRLPGFTYEGNDPDGFMTSGELQQLIVNYAAFIRAPVKTGVRVGSVNPDARGYRVCTNQGDWLCQALVIATGANAIASVPGFSNALPESVIQLTASDYRNPQELPEGNVLVVGGSASGLQLADEIQKSGRGVTLSVGEHVRMPRTYRGMDIFWWMDLVGLLDERYDQVDDLQRVRHLPSPQLVGSPERRTLDINALQAKDIRVTGKLMGVANGKAQFSGALKNIASLADLKLGRLLNRFDEWASLMKLDDDLPSPERLAATVVEEKPLLSLDFEAHEIRSVVWATGFRPNYPELPIGGLDRKGNIKHKGGVAFLPGLYVMGLPFMRRRRSSYIQGAEEDAHDLSSHLLAYLDSQRKRQTVAVTDLQKRVVPGFVNNGLNTFDFSLHN